MLKCLRIHKVSSYNRAMFFLCMQQVNLNSGPHRSIKVGPHGQSPAGTAQTVLKEVLEEEVGKQETQIPPPPPEEPGLQAEAEEQKSKQEMEIPASPQEMESQEGGREAQRQSTGGVASQGHVQTGQNPEAGEQLQGNTGQRQALTKLGDSPSEVHIPSQAALSSEQIGPSSEAHSPAQSKARARRVYSKAPSELDKEQPVQHEPTAPWTPWARSLGPTSDRTEETLSNTPSELHHSTPLQSDPTTAGTRNPQVLQVKKGGVTTEGKIGEHATLLHTGVQDSTVVQTGLEAGNQGRDYLSERKETRTASEATPSSPPGVVAVPKQMKVVNKRSEVNVVEQPGVKVISKDKYGVKGEEVGGGGGGGGGGAADSQEEEVQMSAKEIARAIQAGEMVRWRVG